MKWADLDFGISILDFGLKGLKIDAL